MSVNFFYIVIACWWLSEIWIFLREAGTVKKAQDKNTRFVVLACIFAGIGIAGSLQHSPTNLLPGDTATHLLLCGIVMAAGVILRIWAVTTLGKFFRTTVMIQKAHKVIDTGPYTYIRHPSYTGGLLSFLGLGIAFGNAVGLAILILLCLIGFSFRINTEEQVLQHELGAAYKTYMKRTKRLIPFIY